MKNLSDEELLKLFRVNNERAFTVLFDRYKTQLFRHIYQRINSYTIAEEILQNIFLSVWKNRLTIVISETIFPYLIGAAKNCVFEYYAISIKEIAHNKLLLAMPDSIEYPQEEILIARELEVIINKEVQKMPTTMRQVFILSRSHHNSVSEIAVSLSLSEQTVKNNITLAKKHLRLKLDAKYMMHLIPLVLFLN